jgi:hypothetical protein
MSTSQPTHLAVLAVMRDMRAARISADEARAIMRDLRRSCSSDAAWQQAKFKAAAIDSRP